MTHYEETNYVMLFYMSAIILSVFDVIFNQFSGSVTA